MQGFHLEGQKKQMDTCIGLTYTGVLLKNRFSAEIPLARKAVV